MMSYNNNWAKELKESYHQNNNLQEEMELNEDLLMLIDVLCEELGIDTEELLSNLSEDYTTAQRRDELTDKVLSAVSKGNIKSAQNHLKTLDDESADTQNVYGKGGKKLKKAAGFGRVPGRRKPKKVGKSTKVKAKKDKEPRYGDLFQKRSKKPVSCPTCRDDGVRYGDLFQKRSY